VNRNILICSFLFLLTGCRSEPRTRQTVFTEIQSAVSEKSSPYIAIESPTPRFTPTLFPTFPPNSMLPVLAGAPVPVPSEAIATGNAGRIIELAHWGLGIGLVVQSPDGRYLAINSNLGIYLCDAQTLDRVGVIDTTDEIYSMAFSRDGSMLAFGSTRSVGLWDVSSGHELRALEGYQEGSTALAFTPDGTMLASAAIDKTITLWDVSTGQEWKILHGIDDLVDRLIFSMDGRTLISESSGGMPDYGSDYSNITFWSISTGEKMYAVSGGELVYSSDGNTLAFYSREEGRTKLWSISGKRELLSVSGNGPVFSTDGNTLATIIDEKNVGLWDVVTGRGLVTLTGHAYFIRTMDFSPDGRILATGSDDQTIKIWDTATGREAGTLDGFDDAVDTVSFLPDGATLVSRAGNTIRLLNIHSGTELAELPGDPVYAVNLAFSPDGKILAVGKHDGSIKLWDAVMGRERRTLIGHNNEIRNVTFSPDGKVLASAGYDNHIKLWDVDTGKELRSWAMDPGFLCNVVFSPDGQTLASGQQDGTILFWDVATGQVNFTLQSTDWPVSISYSPDGRMLAVSMGSMLEIWDIGIRQILKSIPAHRGLVETVIFSPDGRTLASGSSVDATIRLWDVASGRNLFTWSGKSNHESLAFSPDGRLLAAGFYDPTNTIQLWDIETGKELTPIHGHKNGVNGVVFSPDGKWLASGSWDGSIRLWGVAN
jgi:WD40 repeat protein